MTGNNVLLVRIGTFLEEKIISSHDHRHRILVPLRGSFKNFRQVPHSVKMGVPLRPRGLIMVTVY